MTPLIGNFQICLARPHLIHKTYANLFSWTLRSSQRAGMGTELELVKIKLIIDLFMKNLPEKSVPKFVKTKGN